MCAPGDTSPEAAARRHADRLREVEEATVAALMALPPLGHK
jgi:hypothetical protein